MAYDFIYRPVLVEVDWKVKVAVLPLKENMDYRHDLKRLVGPAIKLEHYRLFAKEGKNSYRLIAILLTDHEFGKITQRASFNADLAHYLAQTNTFDIERMWIIEPSGQAGIGIENRRRLEDLLGTRDIYGRVPVSSWMTRSLLHHKYGESFLGAPKDHHARRTWELCSEDYGY